MSEFAESAHVAHRYVIAQSWWLASELARRNPDWIICELHPADGMYDVLCLTKTDGQGPGPVRVMLNREGTIQVHSFGERLETLLLGTWNDAYSMQSPHRAVKAIEVAASIGPVGQAPATTPRTLAYRLIATTLNVALNDRHRWDARNEFFDTAAVYSATQHLRGYLDVFPAARDDLREARSIGWGEEPDSHCWGILRDGEPVGLVTIHGWAYVEARRIDLTAAYARHEGSMLRVVAEVFGAYL